MYLAPLNYDRYFKKVFSDERIAKRFLEDFLNVTIEEIERLPEQHRVTDDAAPIEFDYRCKIEGNYVIIDMQQWYKPDVVQRFYLYHALNTGLQAEQLPKERILINKPLHAGKKMLDYRAVEPVLTLVWMVSETFHFTEDYIAYTMLPELIADFLRNEQLWHSENVKTLLAERQRVLKIAQNGTKSLDFLPKNRLIFLFQRNIVKSLPSTARYQAWFHFAEKSRNTANEERDFQEFQGDEIFEEMIRRLNKGVLTTEDISYIDREEEMWAEVERWEMGYYQVGVADGRKEGLKEGEQKGLKKSETKTVRRLAQKGMAVAEIADLMELPITEIEQILASSSKN
jgi:hypothetical protein